MKRFLIACFASISCIFALAQSQPNFKIATTFFKKDTVQISKFGAVADGRFLNTQAINAAIDFMHKKGGGVVVIPQGQWLSGPIVLKSNVNLHLQKSALLVFTSDFSQYPLVASSFEGVEAARCQSPISAVNETNIAITGFGIINGNGMYWRPLKKEKLSDAEWKRHLLVYGGALTDDKKTWYPSKAAADASKLKDIGKLVNGKKLEDFENIKDFLRPNMLRISGCSKVLVEGVTFENSPAWTTHFLMSNDITIKGMKVKNPWWGTNTDAIDLESCSNAILEDCVFDTGDDGITIKSGRDEDGRKRGMPTQNIIIKNCTVYHAHGGFVIGSEMSGGAKNIYISDCTFIGSDIGLRFKTVRGRGGVVENIYAHNINMKDIVGEAILFDMYYAAVDPIKLSNEEAAKVVVEKFPVTEATPQFQHFYFDNIVCDGASKAVFVRGLPEMHIKDVNLDGMFIKSRQGIQIEEATGVSIKNSSIQMQEQGPMLIVENADQINIDTIALKKAIPVASNMVEKFAATAMQIWPDSFSVKPGGKARWSYDQGVILKGIDALWNVTGDAQYFRYMQNAMDYYVKDDGSIYDYKPVDFNLDHLNNGKILLTLYQVTGKEKYKKAIDQLRAQLVGQPRNTLGGFWHKKIYPNQMWLDGLYMGAGFYAQYAAAFNDSEAYADITRQFVLAEQYTRDDLTGLLYHAWDESKQQQWADPKTGKSPHVWGRAMGWYGMALVDALDYYPENNLGRDSLIQILQRWSKAVVKVQDPKDGLWLDILDAPNDSRNYKEASAASMFTRVLLKAIRKGYIQQDYLVNAKKAYAGILSTFIESQGGLVNLKGTVSVSGLGGNPYRDGSLDYYFKEPVVVNDPKGMGAFLQCAVEAEYTQANAKHPVILLDAFYNNEIKKDAFGHDTRWHYAWEDISNGGFGMFGKQFENKGAQLKTLTTEPTALALSKAAVYIMVDPDNSKDNPTPNYMNTSQAAVISDWVKAGGVFILLANDSANCDLAHLNLLAEKFGIQFTNESVNMVKGTAFEMGAAFPVQGNNVLKTGTKLYVKEVSVMKLKADAKAIAMAGDKTVAAVAAFGKGHVLAVGDPWLYNEYVDGRKLPLGFQNFEAMGQIVNWALTKTNANHK
jgi:unsaturated rhamnogalacturonyl hydrolase